MQTLLNIPTNFSPLLSHPAHKNYIPYNFKLSQPINYCTYSSSKIESFHKFSFKNEALSKTLSFSGLGFRGKDGILFRRRVVMVKSNKGFNELGSGGGGRRINGETARVLGNLGLAILLTYLTMSGQLGWLLDAIVSLWLIAVLVPIVGIGAFLWWAGRDIVQSSCPNCGNEFQIFKSTLNDEVQLCPFCSQPFSVEGNEFVADPVKFSNQSTRFDPSFNDSAPPRTKRGKGPLFGVVDIEADIRDAE